jgi:hypothetical protein
MTKWSKPQCWVCSAIITFRFDQSQMTLFTERKLNDSVSQFGARTLLKGVATGSTELRRKYARLFAELATHGSWMSKSNWHISQVQ